MQNIKSIQGVQAQPITADKRLLFVGPKPPPIGGSPLTVQAMLEEFAYYPSLQVTVINTSPGTDVRKKMTGFNFEKVRRTLAILPQFLREIGHCDAALVFANDFFAITLAPVLLLIARIFHKPFFLKPVGAGLDLYIAAQKKPLRAYLLRVLRSVDGILTQTQLLKEDLAKLGCTNAHYLPGCRPLPALAVTPRQYSEEFRIIYLAHITRLKGPLVLLNALKNIPNICETPIICDFYGPIHDEIRDEFLDTLETVPCAHYRGVAEPGTGPQLISNYDVLVLPTYYDTEGHPGVLIEAMHAGVPVISTQLRTFPELIKHGTNGLLVPTQNDYALAEAILVLAINPDMRKQMGEANHLKGQEFRADAVVARLLRIIFPRHSHSKKTKLMHILILGQCYAPEDVSAAVLITELATDLARRGHEVSVVTGAPSYPYGRVFNGYRNRLCSVEHLDGVRVVRVWSHISPSRKFLPRLLHYGTYSAAAFYGGLCAGRPDLILSYSPPLPLGLSAFALSRLWKIPWVLQIEDLYPDAAVAAGVMTNQRLIAFFRAMELFQYRHAQRISVISQSFRQNLLDKGVPDEKIEVIPVWADPDEVRPMEKQNNFRRRFGMDSKFVVMYAGNIGLTSCLEDVLHAADLLREQRNIQFVIVGEGARKDSLVAEMHERQLSNILFLPYQPREVFPEMLAASDINLVTLNAGAALSSLPSKIFNVMASARPVLAVSPPGSEIMQIVEGAGCGWNVPPESPRALAEAILRSQARGADLVQIGLNGRACLEKKYARHRCVDAYEKMFTTL